MMNQRLSDQLEDCRQRLARGESIASCLAAHPDAARELALLLPLVQQLHALQREPDALFARQSRSRFLTHVMNERQTRQRTTTRDPMALVRRMALPLGLAASIILSGGGLATVSAGALPDSPLYPVQQVTHAVVRRFKFTSESQAVDDAMIVNRKLHQLQIAHAGGKGPVVVAVLTAEMVQASARATDEIKRTPQPERGQLITRFEPLLAQEAQVLAAEARSSDPTAASFATKQYNEVIAQQQALGAKSSSAIPDGPVAGAGLA